VIGEADDVDGDPDVVLAAGESVIMCHVNANGTFADVMVASATVAGRLEVGDTIGTCALLFCGDS
jgi:hypothetical protein